MFSSQRPDKQNLTILKDKDSIINKLETENSKNLNSSLDQKTQIFKDPKIINT